MSNKADKLTTRISYIIAKLNEGHRLDIKELSVEFNVSTRTLQKDFNERICNFLPVVKKDGKYYLEDFVIGKLSYEDIERFAQRSGINKLYPTLEDTFISDILHSNTQKALMVKGSSYEDISSKAYEFDVIRLSIIINHRLEFIYNNKQRVVNPYKLVNNDAIWYLVGEEEDMLKTFSFTKIKQLKQLKDRFIPNNELLEIIHNRGSKWFSKERIKVILEIDSEVAEYFTRRDLLPQQTLLNQTATKLTLQTTISYDEEILKVVRYWIPHIKIIEPEYLNKKLKDSLKNYLKS